MECEGKQLEQESPNKPTKLVPYFVSSHGDNILKFSTLKKKQKQRTEILIRNFHSTFLDAPNFSYNTRRI
jgi:hypothetical protein